MYGFWLNIKKELLPGGWFALLFIVVSLACEEGGVSLSSSTIGGARVTIPAQFG